MSEPDGKPPEKKLSPWKQFLEDVSWDIWFFRAFGNLLLGLFFEEGKAVKSGWFAFAVFTVIAFWGGCHYSERNIDAKLSDITNYFGGILAQKESDIAELKGALANAKADRDKNQLLLAPFQAAALKIYTNEPLTERLDSLANELGGISKQADVVMWINDNTNLLETDLPIGSFYIISNSITLNDRRIRIYLRNAAKYPAVNSFVYFSSPLDSTNLTLDGWIRQPPSGGDNGWRYNVSQSIGKYALHDIATIGISTNFAPHYFIGHFQIGADNAEARDYNIMFSTP